MNVKGWLRSLPVIGPLSRKIVPSRSERAFAGSRSYWEGRYAAGGDSGAGSYNRLARFKAEYLNALVHARGVGSVIEFGCGDGAQLTLADYSDYTGVDVSRTVLAATRGRFADRASFRFLHVDDVTAETRADLGLSLDVVYHLVEDAVFSAHMNQVFDASRRLAVVYASNEDKPWPDPHVRHRRFTEWVARNRPDFRLAEQVPNRFPYDPADADNTSFADFYLFERVR